MFHNFNLWMPIWPMESNNDIENGDMNTVGWRKYGRSINNSKKVKCLACSIEDDVGEITREAAQCLQAFFEELKDNTSIESFNFDIALSTTISASDMRHFFRNNYKLRSISISIGQQISVAQCANVATAMRYVFVDKFIIKGQLGVHSNNEAFRRLMSACQTVKKLSLCYLEENDHFTAVAELLRNSTTLIQEIELNIYDSPNLDIASAENELIESLIQNSHLKRLNTGLFRGVRDMERFKTVLCDTTSLASVCQSNHILEHITVNGRDLHDCGEYLKLNKISNKKKVIQRKLMKYYFSLRVDLSSPAQSTNTLGIWTEILGIDVPEKQSALFNILKCIPELCDVSSRSLIQSVGRYDEDGGSDKKCQKVAV